MRYEAGDDRQGRGRDAGAHRVPAPSERGEGAEPDALHDPVRREQGRSARDFGVTGAGGADEVGALRRPQGSQGRVGPDSRGSDSQGPDSRGPDPRETGPRTAGSGRAGHTAGAGHSGGSGVQLLPHGERDKLGLRLQQAVNQFVDEPRRAVEEADHVLEETTRHLAETLAEQHRSLRGAWQSKDRESETEELRVALRKYREVTERLLQL